ncbi:hypothetical protein IHQ68_10130 [Chelatococcus sambhunathii]|uniref:Uncharacterized protein n=1 Tax=Chelatococcus sambhunathii TaxID=363953 RepID=A0ABU1DFT6_9HYPH|nr:hypothetical protein [Chelatococcus sambhunathii]MDR4306975.1 hypothetical protein [Chelatococcus sambhunathii]
MSRAATFTMVRRSLWRSERFARLHGDRERLLYLYLLTCAHITSCGVYRLPDGYACADLGWKLDDYVAARDRVKAVGLIQHDPETEEIAIDRYLHACPPANPKHAQGVRNMIYGIESDKLREAAEEAFAEVWTAAPAEGGSRLTQTGYFNGRDR